MCSIRWRPRHCWISFAEGGRERWRGAIMRFNKINRIAEHPRRADQSAVCAINRHLLWVEDPHRGCPGYFVHVHYAICLLSWVTLGLSPTRIPNPSPVAFAAKPGRRDETDRAR